MLSRFLIAWLTAVAGVCAVTAAAAERTLTVDQRQSRVDIVVKATLDSFTGRLEHYEPSVVVDDRGVVSARFVFHFRDVFTGKAKRDEAMHEWQNTTTFPDGAFVLSSLTPGAAGEGGLVARGNLTFHGSTHELTFPLSVQRAGALYAIDGEAIIDTREFGLPVFRAFAVLKVDPLVRVRFHLQGRDPQPTSP